MIANSLFTDRQIYIIYRKLINGKTPSRISRGAYYRQIKQCRYKIIGILYSILLLESIGAVDYKSLSVLETLSRRMGVIAKREQGDITDARQAENVMFALRKTLDKMCNV